MWRYPGNATITKHILPEAPKNEKKKKKKKKEKKDQQIMTKQTPPMKPPAHKDLVSILQLSVAYRPVRVTDGPTTARCRFIKNASWELTQSSVLRSFTVYIFVTTQNEEM